MAAGWPRIYRILANTVQWSAALLAPSVTIINSYVMTGQKDSYSFGNNANVLYLFINEEKASVEPWCQLTYSSYYPMYAGFDMRSMSRLWIDRTHNIWVNTIIQYTQMDFIFLKTRLYFSRWPISYPNHHSSVSNFIHIWIFSSTRLVCKKLWVNK